MILIVCVDDNNGMMFHHRRQSRDRILCARIIDQIGEKRLRVSPYTEALFDDKSRLSIGEDFLEAAEEGDVCFAEDIDVSPYEQRAEKIILYRWNRTYPSDQTFRIPLAEHGWRLESKKDFAGFSHDKITEEIYRR